MTYVELQVASHFSFLRGVSSAEELFAAAALLGYPALGLTDRNSVGGLVKGLRASDATGVRLDRRLPARSDGRHRPAGLAARTAPPGRGSPGCSPSARAASTARRARRGNASSTGRMSPPGRDGLVAALVPDEADRVADIALAQMARHFRRARPSRAHPSPPAGRGDAAACAGRAGPAPRRPQPRHRRRALRQPRQAHAPGRRHRDPRASAPSTSSASAASASPTAISRAPEEMERRFARLPRRDPGDAPTSPSAAPSLCGELELPISRRDRDVGPHAAGGAGAADPRRRSAPCSRTASPQAYADLLEHELRLVEKLGYAPYFLTVNSIVQLRAQPGDPLPGPRLGGQFDDLLRARHHLDRSGQAQAPVRALHLRRPRRAARHRRRFRA